MVHIILTASSGVADKLRTGAQPIPSKLTDKIGEQATPSDPGKTQRITHLAGVEYASYTMVPSANTISFHTNESIRVQSRK
jgi:hypothetical protein